MYQILRFWIIHLGAFNVIFSGLTINGDCFPCILINGNRGEHKGECIEDGEDLGQVFLGFTDIFSDLERKVNEAIESGEDFKGM